MNKPELIDKCTLRLGRLPRTKVEVAIGSIIELMNQALSEPATKDNLNKIELRGFGSFSVHIREPRMGRNPKTGEDVKIPTRYFPHFKPGKELRERVNASA